MIFQSKSLLATTAIVGCSITSSLFDTANAHGYLKTPRSRNWYAYEEAVWWDVKDTDPVQESDPYSANRGGTAAQCGIIIDRNYDLPKNAKDGGLLKPVIQECYEEGSVIDVEVTLTAYHGGHFEFYACPISWGEVPTEACFKAHPLEFVEDVLHGAPKDPNYPTRAYIHGLSQMSFGNFHYKYKLPTGLLGELVLIQWYYVTGNTCTDEGYADYAFNVAAGFVNYNPEQTATCQLPITGDGSEAPERFWNCAEVRVTEDCSITTTTTTTPPTVCTPISQEELGYSVTAVSQESCNKCALNNVESTYWPCDSNPPLCDCHQGPTGTTTSTQAATTTTTSSTTTPAATTSQATTSTTAAPETTTTTTATSETTTTTTETETTTTTTENSPTTSTFATAPIPSPTAPNQITTCRAVTAEEFEAKNENPNSATTDDLCAQCAPPPAGTDYQWWPCNTASPALCVCDGSSSGTTTQATSTSTAAPEETTTTSTSTAAPEETTTTTTTTTENSPTTSSPTTSNQITTCRAVTAEEFEAKNENPNSATTDDLCAQCAPPPAGTDYQWWPCNTALCVCDGSSTGSTTQATSTSTAAPEETTTTSTATTTSTTTSTNGQTSTTTAVSTGGRTCRAKTKEEISTNEWPVTDETCKTCETPYSWWPCASNNDLCHCE